jgi:hypothetical protein
LVLGKGCYNMHKQEYSSSLLHMPSKERTFSFERELPQLNAVRKFEQK